MADTNVLTFTLRIDLPALLRDIEKGMEAIASMVEKAQRTAIKIGVDIEGVRKQAQTAAKVAEEELAKAKPKVAPTVAPAAPSRASGGADIPMTSITNPRSKKEVEEYLISLRATEAEMKRLGQTGSAEFKIIQSSIHQAEEQEKKFAQQAKNDANLMAQLKGQMGKLGGQFGEALGMDKIMGLLPGMQSGMGSLFSTIGMGNPVLSVALAGVTALAAGFHAFLHVGEEFEGASNKMRVQTGATGEKLEELNESLKKVYASTSAGDLQSMAADMGQLNSMTGAKGPVLEKLTGQMAKLDKMDMGTSVKSFARYIGDANIPTKDASKALDGLFVASQKSGIGIEEISRMAVQYGAPMRNFGFTTFESTALLAKFQKEGVNTGLVMGSLRIAAGKFARAGIDLKTGLAAAIEKIKESGSASQATALAMGTFGARAGADMADAIRGGHFEMTKWLAELKGAPDTIDKAKSATATFSGSFEVLKRNAEVAIAPIGEALVQVLKLGADALNAVLIPALKGVGAVVSATVVPAIHGIGAGMEFVGKHKDVMITLAAGAVVLAVAMNASAIASGALAAMEFVQSVATGVATAAQWLLNAAMEANPIGAVILLVTALVVVYELLAGSVKEVKAATEDAATALDAFHEASAKADEINEQAEATSKLADEYDRLKDSTDPKDQQRLVEVSNQLAATVPDAAEAVGDLGNNAEGAAPKFAILTEEVRRNVEEQRKLAAEAKANALADMDDSAKDLAASIKDTTGKLADLRAQNKSLETEGGKNADQAKNWGIALVAGPLAIGAKMLGLWGDSEEKIKSNRKEINKLSPELQAAKEQQQKMIGQYGEMGFSIQEVADRLHLSVDLIKQLAPPDMKASVVNSQAYAKAMADVPEDVKQITNQVASQAEAVQKANAAVTDLQNKRANAKNIGDTDLVKQLDDKIAEAQKTADEKQIALKATLSEEGTKEALDKVKELSPAAQKLLQPVTQTVNYVQDAAAEQKVREGAGQLATDITEIQHKSNAAQSEDQKKVYGQELLAKQEKYRQTLVQEATTVGALSKHMDDLKAAKDRAHDPAQITRLNAEINVTATRLDGAKKGFANTAIAAQKLGATKGDVHQIGTELRLSGDAAKGAAESVDEITQQLAGANDEAAEMLKKFQEMGSAAQKAVNEDIGAMALEAVKKRMNEVLSAEEQAAADQARAKIGADVKTMKMIQKTEKDLRDKYIDEDKKTHQKRAGKLSDYDIQRRKLINEARAHEIDDELARKLFEINAEKSQNEATLRLQKRQAQLVYNASKKTADDLRTLTEANTDANEKIKLAEQEAGNKRDAAVADARAKLGVDILKVNDDNFQADLADLKQHADSITEQDLASLRRRGELLRHAAEGEKKSKLDAQIQSNELFQRIAKESSQVEVGAVIEANLAAADAQQKASDRRQVLEDAALARHDELKEKNKDITEEQIAADTKYKELLATLDTDPELNKLIDSANKQGTKLADARTTLSTRMEGIRAEMLAALTTPTDKLSEAQRDVLAKIKAEEGPARDVLIQQLLNIGAAGDEAIKKTTKESGDAIRDAMDKLRIDSISNAAEKERELKKIEIRKAYEDELKSIQAGELFLIQQRIELRQLAGEVLAKFNAEYAAATTDDERDEASRRRDASLKDLNDRLDTEEEFTRKLEELAERRKGAARKRGEGEATADADYAAKQVSIYTTSTTLVKGLFDEMYKGIDDARRQEMTKEFGDITKQRAAATNDIRQRKVSLRDFIAQSSALLKQQQDKAKALGLDASNFWSNMQRGALSGMSAVAKYYNEKMHDSLKELADDAITRLDVLKTAAGKASVGAGDAFSSLFDGSEKSMKAWANVAAATFANIGSEFGRLAAMGATELAVFGDAAILQVLKTTQAMIGAYLPAIMAAFVAALGPFGIPAGIAAIAVVEGLMSYAEAKIQGSLSKKGFNLGGYTGEEGGIVHRREFVMTEKLTSKHRPFFQRMLIGENPLTAAFAEYGPAISRSFAIDQNGLLVQLVRTMPTFDTEGLSALARLRMPTPSRSALGMDEPHKDAVMIKKAIEENTDITAESFRKEIRKTNQSVVRVAEEIKAMRRIRPVSPHYWGSR